MNERDIKGNGFALRSWLSQPMGSLLGSECYVSFVSERLQAPVVIIALDVKRWLEGTRPLIPDSIDYES